MAERPDHGRLVGQAHDVTEENVVAGQGTGEYEAIRQTPAPQFGNFPDSGRPPVERPPRSVPDPGGRPDTTTPADPANADRGDHAANDDLVAELVRRIRARQASGEGGC